MLSYIPESIASADMAAFLCIDVFANPVPWTQIRSKMKDGALDSLESQLNEPAKHEEAGLYEASQS